MSLRIVAISDSHSLHRHLTVPHGDILLHAGDITRHGSLKDLRDFDDFLAELPHRHKIVIAGNHDFCFEQEPDKARTCLRHAVYLEDQAVLVEGLKIYGSPWQPWFYDWAFNLRRGTPLAEKWALIPPDTDILMTHGPSAGILDGTDRGENVGCADLLARVRQIQPKFHVFGHIHEGYGVARHAPTTFINACVCTLRYQPINPPIVFEYPPVAV